MPDTKENRLAVAILTGFAIARLLFAFAIGLGVDESYTVAISRRLSLSYFDHPPLHLWIAHLAALALGENVAVRVVFVCLFFATGWIYYRFASRLFGPRSALIALFALNVTPFFFASAGSWIVPDGPLLFGLALAAWAASRMFFPQPLDEASTWRFWPLVGLGLGLAGLSKYSAILTASGLVAFIVLVTGAAALAQASGAVCIRNCGLRYDNASRLVECTAWLGVVRVSRGARRPKWRIAAGAISHNGPRRGRFFVALDIRAPGRGHRERVPSLARRTAPVSALPQPTCDRSFQPDAALGRARPTSLDDARVVFCIPVDGRLGRGTRRLGSHASPRGVPFVGVCLSRSPESRSSKSSTGWPLAILTAQSHLADPTLEAFEWRDLAKAPIFDDPPRFVISTKWSDAGKIALALGPHIPVFVLSNDPRGWAFLDESESFVGQSGVIVTPAGEAASTIAIARPLFSSLGQPQLYALGRRGRSEIKLALIPAAGLTRGLPMPYAGAAGR